MAATVLMATADLDYFEMTPESPASAASDTSFQILVDTVKTHTHTPVGSYLLSYRTAGALHATAPLQTGGSQAPLRWAALTVYSLTSTTRRPRPPS